MAKKFGFEINADTSGLDKSLKQATSSIDSFAKRNEATFKRVGSAVQNVGKSLSIFSAGVVAAAGGAFLLAKKAGEAADRLLDLEQITGISTDTLQEYQFVAKIAGVNTEALSNASQGLTRRLAGATSEASPLNVALAKLGVTVKDATGGFKSSEVVMDDLITKLSSMDDQTQRNVLGAQIFGGAWKDLAPIFALGADGIADARQEAKDLGLVLDGETLEGANNFRIALGKLTDRLKAMQFRLGAKLAPLLQGTILPLFEKKIIPAIEKMVAFLENLIQKFQDLSPSVQKNILIFGGLITALGPVLLALGTLIKFLPIILKGFAVLTGPIGLVVAAIAGLTYVIYKNWEAIKQWAEDVVNWFIDLYNESTVFRGGIELLVLMFKNLFAVVKFVFQSIWTIIKAVIGNIVARFKLLGRILESLFRPKALAKGIKEYQESVEGGISKVVDNIKRDFGDLTETIAKDYKTAIDNISTGKKEHVKFEASQQSKDKLKDDIAKSVSDGVAQGLGGRAKVQSANAGIETQGLTEGGGIDIRSLMQNIDQTMKPLRERVTAEMVFMEGLMMDFNNSMNDLIMGSITDTFMSLGDAIGNALASGGNVLKAVGQTLLKSLGNFISEMGGMLIKYGTLAVAKGKLDLAIAIPGGGIAAGAAAIAVGVALKAAGAAIASKASGQGGGGRSGNTTPEVSNTRVNTSVGTSGMDVVFRIAGRDLVSVIDRNRNHLDRIGG